MQIKKSNSLGNKFRNLQTAIFSNDSRSILKLPTSVIKLLEIEDNGDLVFAVHKPYQEISELDDKFPAELHFFRKGIPYFIKVSGMAFIIQENHRNNSSEILIKLHKQRLDLYRLRRSGEYRFWKILKLCVHSLFSGDVLTRSYGRSVGC